MTRPTDDHLASFLCAPTPYRRRRPRQPPPGAFTSSSPSVTPTPSASATPKAKKSTPAKHGAAKRAAALAAKGAGGGSRRPTGPKFATVTHLMIKNVMTGLCVDIPGGGNGGLTTPIGQWTCHGTSDDNQRWDLVVNDKGAGPHGADLFSIRNSKDSYCADLPGTGAVSAGTHVTENLCYPGLGDNQMWYLDKKSANSFWIRNYVSDKSCLDVLGTDGAGGKDAALTVFHCDPKDDHLWSFL